jgi:triacylglycerol lipase
MATLQHVLLVPGFFGFANLGDFAYFGHVREFFVRHMRRHGIGGEVIVVQTFPTASLRRRATRVFEALVDVLERGDGVVHLVGHSSGGLDARLVTAPGVSLPTTLEIERYASRVKAVVSLSSPHRGSPLATALSSVLGAQLLKLISLVTIYTLRTGKVPIGAVFYLVRMLSLPQLPIAAGTLLNNIYRDLLSDFSGDRREALEQFMVTVGDDQELLSQVTPAGMEAFNATTFDRPGVRYGSVVTCARPPGLRTSLSVGLSPFRQATHLLFAAFHRITAGMPPTPIGLTSAQKSALTGAYHRLPTLRDNDGMVPTLSQVWGEIIHAAWGDHLDAIGHFYLPTHVPPHFDWLNSGQKFTLEAFERIWSDVARFVFR